MSSDERPASDDASDKLRALLAAALPLLGGVTLAHPGLSAATVAAAVLSSSGRTYTGVCLHLNCGIGFCAEHAAVAEMIKARETAIDTIVAVSDAGVLAPCGRCRELMAQIDTANFEARVVMPGNRIVRLRELLPEHWLAGIARP